MLKSSSKIDEPVHFKLDFVDAIMTVSDEPWQCHPKATYWLPTANLDRVDIYLRLAKVPKIVCMEHFTKLVASRIVVLINKKHAHE